jgi:RNA methyltransferase, TrmH family
LRKTKHQVITSKDNEKLKLIRRLARRRHREREGLFVAEGEDLLKAAHAAGIEPEFALHAGVDVEPDLLDGVSALGSGSRVIAVFRERWAEPGGSLSVYLHGVGDPGNVGTVIRATHALADGPVVLGPGCADPYSPKAVRASMGSIFTRPPARSDLAELSGQVVALDPAASESIATVELAPPLILCLGAERDGLPAELLAAADARARIPIRPDGPDSLNVAVAAAVGLYEAANRMAGHA